MFFTERTIQITETIKIYEGRSEKVPESIQNPEEELCLEIIGSFHLCKNSRHFWFAEIFLSKSAESLLPSSKTTSNLNDNCRKSKPEKLVEIDEDDDSDLVSLTI